MGLFKPINDDHAVETVAFQLTFSIPFAPSTLQAILARHDDWREDLPAVHAAPSLGSPQAIVNPGGVNLGFAHLRPDGSAAWEMRIDQNSIIVGCTRYTRWARIWGAAESLFRKALGAASADPVFGINHLSSAKLQVIDKIVGSEGAFSLDEIFKMSSGYLPEKIRQMGPIWHCDTGWFESRPRGGVTLNGLNVATQRLNDAPSSPEAVIHTTITHQQEARLATPTPMIGGADVAEQIAFLFADMHLTNKKVVSALLSDRLCQAININLKAGDL